MTAREALLRDIEKILLKNPSRMYSREEILNLLAHKKREREVEKLLAELEVDSLGSRSGIYATCMAGTVYFRWAR